MTDEKKESPVARMLDSIIGIVFIAGAALKAIDMPSFMIVIAQYHVVEDSGTIALVAWGSLIVETLLGVALLASARFGGLTHLVANAVLAVFTGLIIYAWVFHDLADCGCFGGFFTMTPLVSVIKNVVMMGMLIAAWFMHRGEAPYEWPKAGVTLAGVGAVAVLIAIGYGQQQEAIAKESQIATVETEDAEDRYFAQFVFEIDGETYNLGEGEYLVAVLGASCEHCMGTVPQINELTLFPELPKVVALMMGDADELVTFRELTAPEFPCVLVDKLKLFPLLENAPPAFHHVVDGVSVQAWNDAPPTMEDLLGLTAEN